VDKAGIYGAGSRTVSFDDFIQICILLTNLTNSLKKYDSQRVRSHHAILDSLRDASDERAHSLDCDLLACRPGTERLGDDRVRAVPVGGLPLPAHINVGRHRCWQHTYVPSTGSTLCCVLSMPAMVPPVCLLCNKVLALQPTDSAGIVGLFAPASPTQGSHYRFAFS